MNRRTFIGAFAWVLALTRSGLERLGHSYKGAVESNQNSQRGKTWAAFEIADLNVKRERAKRPYLEFLRAPTLFAGLYALPAGADDRQPVHKDAQLPSSSGVISLSAFSSLIRSGPNLFLQPLPSISTGRQ